MISKVKILLLVLVLFMELISYSQNQHTISYFDKKGFLTYLDSAYYCRQETDTLNYFRSHYTIKGKTSNLYFEGLIINAIDTIDNHNKYNGLCKWYYQNGAIKSINQYNSDGNLDGIQEEFYESGKIAKRYTYTNGKLTNNEIIEFTPNGFCYKVFEENFTDNHNNWDLLKSEKNNSRIRFGGLELSSTDVSDYCIFKQQTLDSTNFSIEAIINSRYLLNNCKSGIVFGYKDKANYHYFYISKFRYHIGFIENGILTKNTDSIFSSQLLSNDFNKIELICFKDTFYFKINNQIQTYCAKQELKGNNIGLAVNNGISSIDQFKIKQLNKTSLSPKENDHHEYILKNGMYLKVMLQQSGVMFSNNGYIVTSMKNLDYINNILVYAINNDTIKTYEATIVIKNDILNFMILKIMDKNSLFSLPLYSYSYMNSIDTEPTFVIKKLMTKDSISKAVNVLSGENKHLTKTSDLNFNCIIGAPVFDKKNNIMGITTSINESLKVKVVKMQDIMTSIFSLPENQQILRTINDDLEKTNRDSYKNLVIVKGF